MAVYQVICCPASLLAKKNRHCKNFYYGFSPALTLLWCLAILPSGHHAHYETHFTVSCYHHHHHRFPPSHRSLCIIAFCLIDTSRDPLASKGRRCHTRPQFLVALLNCQLPVTPSWSLLSLLRVQVYPIPLGAFRDHFSPFVVLFYWSPGFLLTVFASLLPHPNIAYSDPHWCAQLSPPLSILSFTFIHCFSVSYSSYLTYCPFSYSFISFPKDMPTVWSP